MSAKEAEESIVGEFLEKLEFKKKAIGGVDEIDVLGRMEELASLYEDRMGKLAREAAEAKEALAAAQKRAAEADAVAARLSAVEAELSAAKVALAEAKAGAAAHASPAHTAPLPATDDFMRTLQEVRQDVLAKARAEAADVVGRARDAAEAATRVERDRRARAAGSAREACEKAESAMRKLAAALNDIEALEAGLTSVADAPISAADRLPSSRYLSVDPWDDNEA